MNKPSFPTSKFNEQLEEILDTEMQKPVIRCADIINRIKSLILQEVVGEDEKDCWCALDGYCLHDGMKELRQQQRLIVKGKE